MFHPITKKLSPYFSILNQNRYTRLIKKFKSIPYNEQYETHDFIKKNENKSHYLNNHNYHCLKNKEKKYKTFDEIYQLSDKFKNIPYNEQYETHDFKINKIYLNNENCNGEPMIQKNRNNKYEPLVDKHYLDYDNSFCEYR